MTIFMNKQISREQFILLKKHLKKEIKEISIQDIFFEEEPTKSIPIKINFLYNYIKTITDDNNIEIKDETIYDVIYELILNCPSKIDIFMIDKSLSSICSHYIEKNSSLTFLSSFFLLKTIIHQFRKKYHIVSENINKIYEKSLLYIIKNGSYNAILNENMLSFLHENFDTLCKMIVPARDQLLTYISIVTLQKRFFLKDNEDITYELPQIFWLRIAIGLCIKKLDLSKIKIYYDTMSQLLYIPSTPTLCHSGFKTAQLTSCYLSTVNDDLRDIFQSYGDTAQLAKWAGGIATSWTAIRACGAHIKGINICSQGLIPYLKIEDDIISSISKTGTRRGGKAVYIEPWHYDIEDFLDLKKNTGDHRRRTHDLNTALWIPDLFMERISNNQDWSLFSPDETPDLHESYGSKFTLLYHTYERMAKTGIMKLHKVISAKELWKKILIRIFETGHPWITFKDSCNIRSPQRHCGIIHSSNLCTEITLNTNKDEIAVCNLGSINLKAHCNVDGSINFALLKQTIHSAIHLLNQVIDITYYPVDQAKNANMKHRPIGLGVMGWQDVLFAQQIAFEDKEAENIINNISEFISYHGIHTSIELAASDGTYQSYEGSLWSQGIFPHETVSFIEKETGRKLLFNQTTPTLDWEFLRKKLKIHGIRNSNIFAIAPTATISTIANCFPSIEPIYKNMYVKSNISGEFSIINYYLQKTLENIHLWNNNIIEKIKLHDGSIQDITEIPSNIKKIYKTAFEIDQKKLLFLTAVRGQWIDQSQSHNIFFNSTSGKLLEEIYFYAWQLGLKTCYYLRTLGKSQIEKSTSKNNIQLTQLRQKNKTCYINNEGCESCQ